MPVFFFSVTAEVTTVTPEVDCVKWEDLGVWAEEGGPFRSWRPRTYFQLPPSTMERLATYCIFYIFKRSCQT
jgi:hypothetical protein